MAGDVTGAVGDLAQGFASLFFTGFNVQQMGLTTFAITPTGSLAYLLPIVSIPGQMAQNFTNLLPPASIPAQMSQHFTNVVDTLTDTSITAALSIRLFPLPPALFSPTRLAAVALAVDAIGAPINVGNAVDVSAAAFVNAARMGDGWGRPPRFSTLPPSSRMAS